VEVVVLVPRLEDVEEIAGAVRLAAHGGEGEQRDGEHGGAEERTHCRRREPRGCPKWFPGPWPAASYKL
jgi:hypothetical protein